MFTATLTDAIPISLATLVPSAALGLDLHYRDERTGRLKLYRGADFPIEADDLDRLREKGIKQLYIDAAGRAKYQEYLRQIADPDEGGETVDVKVRLSAVNEVVLDVLEADFHKNPDVDATVSHTGYLGSITADLVAQDEFAASDMMRVLHHDYATFTHSANVSFYATMLAAELGLDPTEVQEIAQGGLLHDLGKLEIADSILCKPGRLDESEFRIVKMHPTSGFRQLAHRDDLSFGQLMMVYQHHERLDGSGYPVGVAGDEIHLWGKICAVVDVYEALTSHRPYRKPMPRRRALELMQRDSGTAFDSEIFACWNAIIQTSFND